MIDARVYEAQVCPGCLTQRSSVSRSIGRCVECDSTAHPVIVRFRVERSQVLKQIDPRASLVERTVYFGCVGQAGHRYFLRSATGRPYSADQQDSTPWGMQVDGGLVPKGSRRGEGVAHVIHEHGWTALAFEDRSVDSRGGSWSVYCIPDTLDGPEALTIAREAYPTIFSRYKFPVVLA